MSARAFTTTALLIALQSAGAQQKVALGHAALPTVSVRLFASVASVHVVGWDRDSVDLSGVIPNGSRADLGGGAVGQRSPGIKMFVEPGTDQGGGEGKLVLHVPHGARLWLKTGSADLDVTGISGGLDLNVVGGSITVHGNPRELRAESMDGNVTVDGVPEWLRIKTATGDITLRGGQDVGASSISGEIRSTGEAVERAKFETTTGAISFANVMAKNASVELETHSGPIDVTLVPRADVEVDAATMTGAIDNQWTRARPVPGRENRGMTLTTSSGLPGARVVVRSFKGTVFLRTKA